MQQGTEIQTDYDLTHLLWKNNQNVYEWNLPKKRDYYDLKVGHIESEWKEYIY